MMRFLLPAALAVALMTPGRARASTVYTYGVGLSSCAQWTLYRENETIGYIFGIWTGTNEMMARLGSSSLVGQKTDSQAVIEEVRLLCRQHPSMKLNQAITATYEKIRA